MKAGMIKFFLETGAAAPSSTTAPGAKARGEGGKTKAVASEFARVLAVTIPGGAPESAAPAVKATPLASKPVAQTTNAHPNRVGQSSEGTVSKEEDLQLPSAIPVPIPTPIPSPPKGERVRERGTTLPVIAIAREQTTDAHPKTVRQSSEEAVSKEENLQLTSPIPTPVPSPPKGETIRNRFAPQTREKTHEGTKTPPLVTTSAKGEIVDAPVVTSPPVVRAPSPAPLPRPHPSPLAHTGEEKSVVGEKQEEQAPSVVAAPPKGEVVKQKVVTLPVVAHEQTPEAAPSRFAQPSEGPKTSAQVVTAPKGEVVKEKVVTLPVVARAQTPATLVEPPSPTNEGTKTSAPVATPPKGEVAKEKVVALPMVARAQTSAMLAEPGSQTSPKGEVVKEKVITLPVVAHALPQSVRQTSEGSKTSAPDATPLKGEVVKEKVVTLPVAAHTQTPEPFAESVRQRSDGKMLSGDKGGPTLAPAPTPAKGETAKETKATEETEEKVVTLPATVRAESPGLHPKLVLQTREGTSVVGSNEGERASVPVATPPKGETVAGETVKQEMVKGEPVSQKAAEPKSPTPSPLQPKDHVRIPPARPASRENLTFASASAPAARISASAAAPAQASPLDLPGPVVAPSAPVVSVKRSIGTPAAPDKGRAIDALKKSEKTADTAAVDAAAEVEGVEDVDHTGGESEEKTASAPAPLSPVSPIILPMTAGPVPARSNAVAPTATAAAAAAAKTPAPSPVAAVTPTLPSAAPGVATALATPGRAGAPAAGAGAPSHSSSSDDRSSQTPSGSAKTPRLPVDDKLAALRPEQAALSWLAETLQPTRPASPVDAPLPTAVATTSTQSPFPSNFSLADVAPPPSPAAMPLWTQAADDPSLRATLNSGSAHVSLDAGAAGELSLHLRIKDGVADVRVDGAAAATLDIRTQDLRAALASEGLTLGSFESGQPQSHHQGHVEYGDEPPAHNSSSRGPSPAAPGAATTAASDKNSQPPRPPGGRVHVTA